MPAFLCIVINGMPISVHDRVNLSTIALSQTIQYVSRTHPEVFLQQHIIRNQEDNPGAETYPTIT